MKAIHDSAANGTSTAPCCAYCCPVVCIRAGEIISILDKRIEEADNRKRQTVLLSATLHSRLSTLASLSLKEFDSVGFRVLVRPPYSPGHLVFEELPFQYKAVQDILLFLLQSSRICSDHTIDD